MAPEAASILDGFEGLPDAPPPPSILSWTPRQPAS
jgi:hypothetical protein